MPEIALEDVLNFGLAYVLAFVLIGCFLCYFFRMRPAEEREKKKVLEEMARQSALCVQSVDAVAKCLEQNTRAMEGVQEALEVVARQETVMLELQRSLYADMVRGGAQGCGAHRDKTS